MTRTHSHRPRRSLAPVLVVALAVVAGCGDDDTDDADTPTTDTPTTDAPTTDAPTTDAPTTDAPTTDAPTTDAPTTEAPTTDAPTTEADADTFCEGFLGVEQAMREAPQDEAEIAAFVEERIQPNLGLIDGNEPADIAAEVRVLTAAVDRATSTGDFSAFETPEFLAASEVVYSSLDDACGASVVEFSAVDFDYEGIPETLPAGVTSFVMTNDSAAGEAHEFSLVKLTDETELSVEELLAMPEPEAEQHIDTFAGGVFAPAGAASGTVVELTPGRWAYVCFIPIGSVDGADASGPPHFTAGMAGEFTVE